VDAERPPDDDGWDAVVTDMLERARLLQPDELAAQINAATGRIGVTVTVYLVDHEQTALWPVPEPGRPAPPPLPLDSTAAGRAFTVVETQDGGERPYRLWVPLVDGSERLGVAEVVAGGVPPDPETFRRRAELAIGLVGHLVAVKMPYGDVLHRVRRTRPMSEAGELILQMLPPLTFSTRRLVISAVLEPTYDVGGDAFEYAVDDDVAHVAVLDAMGRGLAAGLTSATALATMRAARRGGGDLRAVATSIDAALVDQFPELRFVTGVLAELELDSGTLRYLNAGHLPPLLFRNGRAAGTLHGGRRTPLGVTVGAYQTGEETLMPGDRLLFYTDGVTEAYDLDGDRFGAARLTETTERCLAEGLPAPETLRRLAQTLLAHRDGRPADDATLMLVEWSGAAADRTVP
jgi:hypothetical protein